MIRLVGEESRARFGKDGSSASVSLGQDDLVEQLDLGIFGTGRLTLVDEFVEALSLAKHGHVLAVTVRNTSEEGVHIEVVDETCLLAFTGCWMHIATVCVEQGGKTTHKCCSHLIRTERSRADNAYCGSTTAMDGDVAT